MAHSSRISERSFPLPAWVRTPFVVAGLAAIAFGWRYLDGLLALRLGSGSRVSLGAIFLFLIVAVTTLVGVALVSTGLVIPGASRVPGDPELGFSRRQRGFVARGAVLSVVGTVVSVLFSPLSGDSVLSPLVTLPVSLGWALVLFGLVSNLSRELYLYRLVPPYYLRITRVDSRRDRSHPHGEGSNAPRGRRRSRRGRQDGDVFVEWQPPVVLGSVEFAVGCVAFHLGLVLPDSGPWYSADDLTFLGGLVAAASPFLLFALVTLLPASSFVFARSDFVLLGWTLVLLGSNERYGELLAVVDSSEIR
jgi:hypothetical protein